MDNEEPHKVIVKVMSVNTSVNAVYDFFTDVKKSMETGRAASSVTKGADGWWTFDHVTAGRAKLRLSANREAGVIDHTFVGGGLEWVVYVRIVPNTNGSTTTWTFIRPDSLTDDQFEQQLNSFDNEIMLWKNALEPA